MPRSNIDPGYNHAALELLIEQSGLSFRKRPTSYVLDCPRCGGKDKLYIRRSPPDGKFVCWVCGEEERDGHLFRGKPEWALTLLLGRPVREIQELLYGGSKDWADGERSTVNLILPARYQDEDPPDEFQEIPEVCWPPDYLDHTFPAFVKAARYLWKRGIGFELVKKYDIRFHPATQRVVFPVKVGGRLLGWQGRYIHPTDYETEDGNQIHLLKIVSTKGLAGGQALMFQDNLLGSEHAVLTEGPFDALKADLCGGNVAAMGKGVKQGQLKVLADSGIKRLYLALDRDAAFETMRICRELSDNRIEFYHMPPADHRDDHGDSTLAEVRQQFETAERITPSRLFVHLVLPPRYA